VTAASILRGIMEDEKMVWRANRQNLTDEERASIKFVGILTDVAWEYGFEVKNVFAEDDFLREGEDEYYWEAWDGEHPIVFVDWGRCKFKVYGCPEEVKEQFAVDLYNAIEKWKEEHGYPTAKDVDSILTDMMH